jgi:hypothetical protein
VNIEQIRRKFPESIELLLQIERLSNIAATLPFEPFREPLAVLQWREKQSNVLLNLDASYLTCWCQHIAYSMRIRLRMLEPGILAELAQDRLVPTQVLLRAHFEATALAALCVQSLQRSRAEGTWETLRELIPKTLFGTALFPESLKDERLSDMLSLAEQRTVTIAQAIEALDAFAFGKHASGELASIHALLCDASEPNHRGTRGFMAATQLDDSAEYGWRILYSSSEVVEPSLVQRILETLLLSMRHGYCAAELLRRSKFTDEAGGPVWHGVPRDLAAEIWTTLLQRDLDKTPP